MKKLLLIVFVFIVIGIFVEKINLKPEVKQDVQIAKPEEIIRQAPKNDGYRHIDIEIGSTTLDSYISDTEKLRENGLSGFTDLVNYQAMLFIFPNSDMYGFWMKDMLFSLDIVWLDENKKVVSFEENVAPETYPKAFFPKSKALYVLEIKAGRAKSLGLYEGESVHFASGK